MPIIELNKGKSSYSRNDYSKSVRVAYSDFGLNKKGISKIGILINVGQDVLKEASIKPTDKIALEIDTDTFEYFILKRCDEGYSLVHVGAAYKVSVTWKFPVPNNDRSVKVLKHEIMKKGIKVYLDQKAD